MRVPAVVTTLSRGLVLALCTLFAAELVYATRHWDFRDMGAYLAAAHRLQVGLPLYIRGVEQSGLYLYAPWFAFLWIPLTHVPRPMVEIGWTVLLMGAIGLAVVQFRRSLTELCFALLCGALLWGSASWGNVQPLLVLALMVLIPTRAGPWALGVTASLKVLPILFVAIYVWRRQWRSAAIAVGVAALLWAPILLFDLSGYPTSRGLKLYDITWLMALPAAIAAGRSAGSRMVSTP
jgi:hypothetical protein